MNEWFYTRDKKTRNGPVPFSDLQRLAKTGGISPTDMLQQIGVGSWVAAGSVPGLFPPSPNRRVPAVRPAPKPPAVSTPNVAPLPPPQLPPAVSTPNAGLTQSNATTEPTAVRNGLWILGIAVSFVIPPLGFVVALGSSIVAFYGFCNRCPACNRWWACQRMGVKTVERKRELDQDGKGLGVEETVANAFQCKHCSHDWFLGHTTRSTDICPGCTKEAAREHVGDNVLGHRLGHKIITTTSEHYQAKPGPFFSTKHEYTGQSVNEVPVAVQFEVFREQYRCRFCGVQWQSKLKKRER